MELAYRKGWQPPPRISVPEWADRYRVLAKEAGSTSGRWHTSTVEIARGPMLAVTEPGVHTVTTMCCTQLMKTALLENVFGYFAHLDPCPMLLLQPKEDAAEQFSKERIAPMLRVTPVLRELVGTAKTRSSEETLLFKAFPGGFLALAGAGSPDNLARRPIRVLLCDEVDKYPVTREGDPITLGEERLATFVNWLSLRACSPTITDESRIADSYAESDQRRASVVCPHCEHRLFLDFFRHVQWPKSGDRHDAKAAQIFCEACGAGWSEGERLRALATIRWHQTRPFTCCGQMQAPLDNYESAWRAGGPAPLAAAWNWWAGPRHAVYRARCLACGAHAVPNEHAGFQASKLFSPWQKDRPADIAAKFLAAAGDAERMQAWWNTQMGLPHRPDTGKAVAVEGLAARAESWDGEVPDGVGLLTAGLDTQGDRVEIEIVGWGRNEESWSIAHLVIEGDPNEPELWERVDQALLRRWRRADGRTLAIRSACIDSGGHSTQAVYAFSKARLGRRIWAVKGESAQNGTRNPVWPPKRPSSRSKASFRPIILGVNAAKDVVRSRLQLEQPAPGQPLAGYMHYPADRDLGFFQQLVSERLVTKTAAGKRFRVWELPAGRANEALDLRVYAYAALCGLLHYGVKLNQAAAAVTVEPPTPAEPIVVSPKAAVSSRNVAAPAAPPSATKRRSFIDQLAR